MARKAAILQVQDAIYVPFDGDPSELELTTAELCELSSDAPAIIDKAHNLAAEGASDVALDALEELAVKSAALAEIADQGSLENEAAWEVPSDTITLEATEEDGSEPDPDVAPPCDDIGNEVLAADDESGSTEESDLDAALSDAATHSRQSSTDDCTQSELAQLPGAGPGLVWMLGQCNVKTLSELAECNASNLSTQLGVVGQILDVGQWVVFAQENSQ